MTMTLEARMTTTTAGDRFASYLAGGDHWRARRALDALERGEDGYRGPLNEVRREGGHVTSVHLHRDFAEYLDAPDPTRNLRLRWQAAEEAMRAIEADGHAEAIAALRYFIPPGYRRRLTAHQQAAMWDIGEQTLRDRKRRAIALVWEEVELSGRAGLWV